MASVQSRGSGSRPTAGTDQRPRVRRRIRPITIALAAIVGIAAFGAMIAVLSGAWPMSESQEREPKATVVAIRQAGLTVEKAGEPRWDGDQVFVPVKVTNNFVSNLPIPGTPTAGVATPTAGPTHVEYAGIKIYFYGPHEGNNPAPILGTAFGQVLDLAHGQSKTVEVIGIGVPKSYADWEPEIDNVQARLSAP